MPQYFCYQCQRTVSLRDADFICAQCGGEFIEEVRHQFGGAQGAMIFGQIPEEPAAEGGAPAAEGAAAAAAANPVPPRVRRVNLPRGSGAAEAIPIAAARGGLEEWMRELFAGAAAAGDAGAAAAGGGNAGRPLSVHVQITPNGMTIRNGPAAAGNAAENGAAGAAGGGRNTIQMNFPENMLAEMVAGNLPEYLQQILDTTGMTATFGNHGNSQRGFTEDQIRKYLPMTKVTAKHVENGAQCTTCFDTFKLDDPVGKLDCDHIFHRPCIEPWLKTKSSCPVCRQPVNMAAWKRKYDEQAALSQFNVLEDLD